MPSPPAPVVPMCGGNRGSVWKGEHSCPPEPRRGVPDNRGNTVSPELWRVPTAMRAAVAAQGDRIDASTFSLEDWPQNGYKRHMVYSSHFALNSCGPPPRRTSASAIRPAITLTSTCLRKPLSLMRRYFSHPAIPLPKTNSSHPNLNLGLVESCWLSVESRDSSENGRGNPMYNADTSIQLPIVPEFPECTPRVDRLLVFIDLPGSAKVSRVATFPGETRSGTPGGTSESRVAC